jgi:hypothetical protein
VHPQIVLTTTGSVDIDGAVDDMSIGEVTFEVLTKVDRLLKNGDWVGRLRHNTRYHSRYMA